MADTLSYINLSKELEMRIADDRRRFEPPRFACPDEAAVRRDKERDKNTLLRPSFIRDVDKIMHSAYYNRYTDKTQVFSFYKNDDITRRALHVQLVSRIARNIARLLNLNQNLIEAIALGHDIGHTPFGHAGERFLNEIYHRYTNRYFNHNVHSIRVLDGIFHYNLSLQTLDGILCHNGELEERIYEPRPLQGFSDFDKRVEDWMNGTPDAQKIHPGTMEGCVVRICDMIAYLGKDRQDAQKAKLIPSDTVFTDSAIGKRNAEIINNLVANIVENSYGKPRIEMDKHYFDDLVLLKRENRALIYDNEAVKVQYDQNIRPMFFEVYEKLMDDLTKKRKASPIFEHHIKFVNAKRTYYKAQSLYEEADPNQIVVDYIASMTDDYFVDLYHYLFPNGKYKVEYISYFNS